jgi:hypothetical protein
MFTLVIALVVLAVAVSAIYLILKTMGEDGIEVAAPGSCKSGRCGVRCASVTPMDDEQDAPEIDESDQNTRKNEG